MHSIKERVQNYKPDNVGIPDILEYQIYCSISKKKELQNFPGSNATTQATGVFRTLTDWWLSVQFCQKSINTILDSPLIKLILGRFVGGRGLTTLNTKTTGRLSLLTNPKSESKVKVRFNGWVSIIWFSNHTLTQPSTGKFQISKREQYIQEKRCKDLLLCCETSFGISQNAKISSMEGGKVRNL